jgi:hypothetical protein
MDPSIAAIGHEHRIGNGIINDALRLIEIADPAHELARSKVNDAQTVVAELRDEQSFAGEVDREMVDPAPHVAKGNLLLEHQRLRLDGRRMQLQACAQKRGYDESPDGQLTTSVQSVHVRLAHCGATT